MNRDSAIRALTQNPDKIWDVIIIGGGATGLGAAVDAASRGFSTLLAEQWDFAKGTSSRSTKLVHGGVRYLAQGDLSLVFESLQERGILMKNAPHLVRNTQFIIPVYDWWEGPFYNIGMKVYDLMAGKYGIGTSKKISIDDTMAAIPNLDHKGLSGGVIYHDCQFDDARLAINLAQTASDFGATVLNYLKVSGFLKDASGLINGVKLMDMETGAEIEVRGKSFINAAGVFADQVMEMDNAAHKRQLKLSQGSHIVLDRSFLQGDSAVMIPHTDDGRVLFAVPWYDRVIVGTTDIPVSDPSLEPRFLEEEIDFLLNTSSLYLIKGPGKEDVLSVFSGIRPLAFTEDSDTPTKNISRKHQITVTVSGLISITGGKWTIYRKMAEDLINHAILVGGLNHVECFTEDLHVHGYKTYSGFEDALAYYGSDSQGIEEIIASEPGLGEKIHSDLPFIKAEIVWAVREEMARTTEDFLARRVRALFLDARTSSRMAHHTSVLMAKELGRDRSWAEAQERQYNELAKGYYLE